MSTPENPFGGMEPPPLIEPRPTVPENIADAGLAERFPVWRLVDVFYVVLVLFLAMFITGTLAALIALLLPAYAHVKPAQMATDPRVVVPSQVVAYMITVLFIFRLITVHYRANFWDSIRWRWPRSWVPFFFIGIGLSLLLQIVSHFLPIPKQLPIEQFFRTSSGVWLMAIFGTFIAPFAEELFFRGLLLPALIERVGMFLSVVFTSLTFALIHAGQLGWSWAALAVLTAVGFVLTMVRLRADSLAASVIVHFSYNGFIFALIFIASRGFTRF